MTAAYDLGAQTAAEQIEIIQIMGADIPDHMCDRFEEPDEIECDCGGHA
jgi:hypothetical protein